MDMTRNIVTKLLMWNALPLPNGAIARFIFVEYIFWLNTFPLRRCWFQYKFKKQGACDVIELTFFEIPFDEMFRHDVHDIGYMSTHSEHVLWNCNQKRLLLFVSLAVRKHGRYMVPQEVMIESEISKSRFLFYLWRKCETKTVLSRQNLLAVVAQEK